MGVGSSEHTQHASQQAPPCSQAVLVEVRPGCGPFPLQFVLRGEWLGREHAIFGPHLEPSDAHSALSLFSLPLTAEGFAICCRASCRDESIHPPSTLPHAVIHLGTMSKQVNLPSTCPHTLCVSLMPARRAILRALALLAFARSVKVQRCPRPGSLPGNSARRTLLAPVVKLPAARRAHDDGS